MDLSGIKAGIRTIDIKHPATGEKTGLSLDLVSLEDDRVKAINRKYQNKAMRGSVTLEDLEEQRLEVIAATIIGWKWEGEAKWGGEKPAYSAAKALEVIKSDGAAFIIRQIDKALGDEAGFFSA